MKVKSTGILTLRWTERNPFLTASKSSFTLKGSSRSLEPDPATSTAGTPPPDTAEKLLLSVSPRRVGVEVIEGVAVGVVGVIRVGVVEGVRSLLWVGEFPLDVVDD